jgi:hypothetical protein
MQSQSPSPAADQRHRDRFQGLLIVAVAFLVSLAISFWAKRRSAPETSMPPDPATIEGIEGWPARVEPVRNLARARELTRRLLFRGFVAEGVKSDGTLDLSKSSTGANVRYSFQSPKGHGPQPPRETGVVPRRDLCGRQSVRIREVGIYAEPDQPEVVCSPVHGEPLPDPGCSLDELWKAAIERGVSAEARARIQYYRAAAGPAFRFQLMDGTGTFTLYGDCERELRYAEAAGHVP